MFTVLHDNIEYPINHIQSMRRDLEVSDAHELNMIVVNRSNNPGYPFIQEEAILSIKGHEYRVKTASEKAPYKNINAVHIVTDLKGMPFNQKLTGSYAPLTIFNILLAGTGWSVRFDGQGIVDEVSLVDFGRNNVWKLFRELCNKLQVEFEILPNRVFNVKKKLSGDYGRQYRYGYNLKNISKDTTSTDVVTHIIVNFGEDLAQTATFISPSAGNYDRAIYGDIINDERIKTEEAAYERAKDKFRDVDLSYDLDIASLGETPGLGETIHTIYEPMNDLSIVTRILKVREEWDGEDLVPTSATVGNYVFKTSEEILQDQIKDTESSVNENIEKNTEIIRKEYKLELSETVTDLEKNITTEYTAMISMTARELKTEMTQHVTTINNNMGSMEARFNSSITQTAAQIRAEVSSHVTTINNDISSVRQDVSSLTITATQIRAEVSSHVTTINNNMSSMESRFNSSLSLTATQIRAEVSSHVTTLNNGISSVRQDVSSLTITTNQIRAEVSSHVTTLNNGISSVRQDVSSLTITANSIQSTVTSHTQSINGLNTQMSSSQSSITQLSNQITSKVSYTDYTGATIISKINQDPYSVSIDAQKINLNGAVIVNGSISGATNIDINRDVTIGNTLYLRGWGRKAIQFDNSHVMETSGGDLDIHAMRNISIGPFTRIQGTLDLSNTTVLGLNSGGNYAVAHTNGLGIAYNGSKRIYFRIHGSDVGYITLS